MRYCLTSLLLLVIGPYLTNLMAQPVLSGINDYQLPTQSTYWVVDPDEVAISLGGEEKTWDFTNWPTNSTVKREVVTANQAPKGNEFPKADKAVLAGSIERYIQNQQEGDLLRGYVTEQDGEEILFELLNPVQIYKRPFGYTDEVQSNGRRRYETNGQTLIGTGNSSTNAIGWGTLQLPEATYDSVVLLRNEQNWQDTVQGPFNATVNSEMISYTWYQPDRPYPLIRFDSINVESDLRNTTTTNLIHYQSESTGLESAVHQSMSVNAYVHQGNLVLQTKAQKPRTLNLRLYTLHGKPVHQYQKAISPGSQQQEMLLPEISPGVYVLKAVPANGNGQPVNQQILVH